MRRPYSSLALARSAYLGLVLFSGVLVATLQASPSVEENPAPAKTTEPRAQLPLDPLTPAERQLAERLALKDARVKELLGSGAHVLISIDLLFLKPEKEDSAVPMRPVAIDRNVEVIFRRQEEESGVRAVVNLTRRSITMASRLESAQVPLTRDDIVEAAHLALENEELRRALGSDVEGFAAAAKSKTGSTDRYSITGLRLFTQAEDDPCYKHRCIDVLLRRGREYFAQSRVWVDLSARKVYVERREQ